jgi:hypothetical protein
VIIIIKSNIQQLKSRGYIENKEIEEFIELIKAAND